MILDRDAFHARYRFVLPKRKEERYQARLLAAGKCVRCRQPRGRDGRYCATCLPEHCAETLRSKANRVGRQRQGAAA